jgi:hypothetical protein
MRQISGVKERHVEKVMRNKIKTSFTENVHPLLECTCMDYANGLRAEYPAETIRNGAVFKSACFETGATWFYRAGRRQERNTRACQSDVAQRVKFMKHQPVWILDGKFPDWATAFHMLLEKYVNDNPWPRAPQNLQAAVNEMPCYLTGTMRITAFEAILRLSMPPG